MNIRTYTMQVLALFTTIAADGQDFSQQIEEHRTGEIVVQAKPGAKVTVEQVSHEFWFGCAISNDFVDGSMSPADQAQYEEKFLQNFNSAVTENALKWGSMEREKGKVNYAVVDSMLAWTDKHNLPLRGHNLFWAIEQFVQPWVKELSNEELSRTLQNRAETVTRRYAGRFAEYDLNNEMVNGNFYEDRLGPAITKDMAAWAHNGDPGAKFFLNEYDVLSGNKLPEFMAHVRALQKQGVPLAGIGMQGHYHEETFDRNELRRTLDSLAIFKLPIRITEFNMPGSEHRRDKTLMMTPEAEAQKAKELTDYYRICFAHQAVTGILMWGFWEGAMWIPVASLYHRDWSPTPAAQAYRDLVFKEWWTRASGKVSKRGQYTTRGFYGTYRVTVEGISKNVLLRQAERKVTVRF